MSAASPRARTSAMMSRTALSTSSETSRFIARRSAKRSPKSGLAISSRSGISFRLFRFVADDVDSHAFAGRLVGRMARLSLTGPARTDVAHLRFEALDREAHARAA